MKRLLAIAVLAVACDSGASGEEPASELVLPPSSHGDVVSRRTGEDTSMPGRGTITPSDDPRMRPPWVDEGGGGGGGGGGGRFPERNGRPMMTPEEAQQAGREVAQRAGATDGSACAQAYVALAGFADAFQKRTPWVPHESPDRDDFMEGCLALPPAQQQCLVPGYQHAHEDECRTALGGRGEPSSGEQP